MQQKIARRIDTFRSRGERPADGDMPAPEAYGEDEDINSADFLDKFVKPAEAALTK